MAELQTLTSQVLKKEKASLKEKVDEKRRQANDEIEEEKIEAKKQFEHDKEDVKAEIERETAIKKNTINIDIRNDILAAKQYYISKLFAATNERLNSLSSDQLQQFASNVLANFKDYGEMTLVVGEHSTEALNQAWLNQQSVENLTLTLSDQTINDEAGFILEQKGIEYNFLLSELLTSMKNDYVADITQKLFN